MQGVQFPYKFPMNRKAKSECPALWIGRNEEGIRSRGGGELLCVSSDRPQNGSWVGKIVGEKKSEEVGASFQKD